MKTQPFRRALVICNGEPPARRVLQELADASDVVIAADGGANSAVALGVSPHVVIGDLDSITRATRRALHSSIILQVDSQDSTDLEKALDFLLFRRITEIVVTGATGRRIDFTLANLSVLWKYTSFPSIMVAGDTWTGVPVRRKHEIRAPKGTIVSVIPFGRVEGISLRGFLYPLRNASMDVGEIGVSNVVESSPATISVRKGNLFAVTFLRPSLRRRRQ